MNETTERFKVLAKRYDLGNTLLTLGLHQRWKRQLINRIPHNAKSVLDTASGTGDLALMALDRCQSAEVVATDISVEMLNQARVKLKAQNDRLRIQEADMMRLPFNEDQFDSTTVAFGLRNVTDLNLALCELGRVTRRQLLILETGAPVDKLSQKLFSFQNGWTKAVGKLLGQAKHYEYLATSTLKFPSEANFMSILSNAYPHSYVTCEQLKPFPVYLYEVRFE